MTQRRNAYPLVNDYTSKHRLEAHLWSAHGIESHVMSKAQDQRTHGELGGRRVCGWRA